MVNTINKKITRTDAHEGEASGCLEEIDGTGSRLAIDLAIFVE
jgi:hypothetical protein